MNKALQLRKIIQDKLYPEGVRLEFGVEVEVSGIHKLAKGFQLKQTIDKAKKEKIVCRYVDEKLTPECYILQNLGTPTTLQELLLAINKKKMKLPTTISERGDILDSNSGNFIQLDLTKTIEKQDNKTLQSLIELVK